ncbi:phage tail assembly chaperone [Rhizobium sp. SA279]
MAFKLSQELTFKWPVKVLEPDQGTPGKLIEREFTAHFAIIDPALAKEADKQRLALFEQIKPEMNAKELADVQALIDAHDFHSLSQVLRGWDGIVGDDDLPIPFREDNFKMVYAHDRVKHALNRAYREALSEDKARLGNSK